MFDASHVEIDDTSYASTTDIALYRKDKHVVAEPDVLEHVVQDDDELDRDNRVNDRSLQKENRIAGGGGSKNKNRKKAVRPLTGPQRIAKHVKTYINNSPEAFEPELPHQRGERHLLQSKRKLEDAEKAKAKRELAESEAEMDLAQSSRGGRPRKGTELRVVTCASIDPDDLAVIRSAGLTPSDALESMADDVRAAA